MPPYGKEGGRTSYPVYISWTARRKYSSTVTNQVVHAKPIRYDQILLKLHVSVDRRQLVYAIKRKNASTCWCPR
jgi:hypothetical protein